MSGLRDKVIVITGASSGIGGGAAEHLAGLGARLVLGGRSAEGLEATKAKCLAKGAKEDMLLTVIGDVTKDEDREGLVKAALDKFGGIDCLVNNAGAVVVGPVEGSPMSDYDWIMDVNTRSIVALTKIAIPHIKAALDQFTKCLALEMAPHGVRVNSINPGVIVTEIHKRGGMDEPTYAAFLERSKTTHALGRPGDVSETAAAIAFLASADSSFTTGHLLMVDGGRGIMSPR